MMSVIKPIVFSPSMLVSTTALEPAPVWVSGTSYSKDAVVAHADPASGNVRRWQSLINSNTVEPSYTATTSWLDIGPCNKCAMFDNLISTQTVAASPLVVEINPGDIVSSLALLNIIGANVRIEMLNGGVSVYDQTISTEGGIISDWWDYYFTEDEQITQVVVTDLPLFYSATIRITVTGSGNVAIGHTVFGPLKDLGELELGAQTSIIDYSKKITDEFGETLFVRRGYADEFSGQVLIDNGQLNAVKRLLRDLLSTPSLWIGCDKEIYTENLIVFGWCRQHNIAIPYPNHSLVDIQIEGLT